MDLAKVLWTAKRKLRYGQWTAMWRSAGLPFSKRQGEIQVVLGQRLENLDAKNSAHLPGSWSMLNLSAQLESLSYRTHAERASTSEHPYPRLMRTSSFESTGVRKSGSPRRHTVTSPYLALAVAALLGQSVLAQIDTASGATAPLVRPADQVQQAGPPGDGIYAITEYGAHHRGAACSIFFHRRDSRP